MKIVINLLLLLAINVLPAQENYWISIKDKAASIYDISNPEEFMHPNAWARRQKFNIPIDETDLPVCALYLDSIRFFNAEILVVSKWLNGVLIRTDDTTVVNNINNLSFVNNLNKTFKTKSANIQEKLDIDEQIVDISDFDYGNSLNQINMLNGQFLHDLDFTGQNIDIAIMDNGFSSVDTNTFYQDAFLDGRIQAGYDFVNLNDTLFDSGNGSHGNSVISTMVSYKEGELVGVSPMANYFLFSTEDNLNEGLREEYNWVFAAEMADTLLGVNAIISTSLGYSDGFNNASENHTYEDMDGNTTPITIGADLAAKKGFLVVNSAGNQGNNAWKYITAPADGDSVLAVGAVSSDGTIADFSSLGPAFDGAIKPNVCAQGRGVYGVNTRGQIVSINGTSFSCPIISGMSACLWQAFPDKSNMEIFRAIEKSAHLYLMPNDFFGFGLPNFEEAYKILENRFEEEFKVFPNPIEESIRFYIPEAYKNQSFKFKLFAENGKIIAEEDLIGDQRFKSYAFSSGLSSGIYYIQLIFKEKIFKSKVLKP